MLMLKEFTLSDRHAVFPRSELAKQSVCEADKNNKKGAIMYNTVNCGFRVMVSTCIVLGSLALAACAPTHKNVTTGFSVTHISCTDQSTPEMKHRFKRAVDGIEKDSASVDALISSSKELADAGNANGMGFYGDSWRSKLILDYLASQNAAGHKAAQQITLPDTMKPKIVEALSYLYISAELGGDPELRAQNLVAKAEKTGTDGKHMPSNSVRIAKGWIKQAQANAKAWKAQCR